jgi:virulence factor Mce-like protein
MLKDLLRYKARPVRIGGVLMVLALLGLAAAYMINTTFSLNFWDAGYQLKADFTDADGIANASDVRIAGTYVGQITQIRSVQGGLAEITIRVDRQHSPLPEGTKANLRLQTLLGTKFIELTPGSSNKTLATNSVIPSNATQSPVDFDQLLSSFDKPTRESTSKIIQELGTATEGRGQTINGLLTSLHGASVDSNTDLTTFGDRQENLDSILVGLDNVAGNLSDNRQHLANVYTNLDAILGTIAANDPGFRRFIEQGNVGLGHGNKQFDGEAQNINDVFRLLNPTLTKLNPILVDVNNITIADEPFIQIVKQFSKDIASANSAYNSNSKAGGEGGWFLRQPVILSEPPDNNNNCERNNPPSTCPGSGFNPGTPAGAQAQPATATPGPAAAPTPRPVLPLPLPIPVPRLPAVPGGVLPSPGISGPALPGVPGLTQPGVAPGPGGPIGALSMDDLYDTYAEGPELALFTFLLGSGG